MTFDDYLAELGTSRGTVFEQAKRAVIDDRDHWLDLGLACHPVELRPYCDRRGLPVFRVQAPCRHVLTWSAA